jgi:hypothetical protein
MRRAVLQCGARLAPGSSSGLCRLVWPPGRARPLGRWSDQQIECRLLVATRAMISGGTHGQPTDPGPFNKRLSWFPLSPKIPSRFHQSHPTPHSDLNKLRLQKLYINHISFPLLTRRLQPLGRGVATQQLHNRFIDIREQHVWLLFQHVRQVLENHEQTPNLSGFGCLDNPIAQFQLLEQGGTGGWGYIIIFFSTLEIIRWQMQFET